LLPILDFWILLSSNSVPTMNRTTLPLALLSLGLACCTQESPAPSPANPPASAVKQDTPPPPLDPNNIVSIAVGSKDHTTLVTALKAADYVRSVANPGPLTVFAPTNAAFDKLPKGTVEGLLKPEKQADLKEIIKYHATPATFEIDKFKDGMQLQMANGKKVTFHVKDGKVTVNDANIVASVRASNGIVHIIDAVLLPPAQ
jgi:uncharacterized surface protein with fasciclin (FAS1) repeats